MLDRVVSVLTSPAIQQVAQNTNQAVIIETGLKAIGRPAFTLADKNVDKDKRKYAATKEFIYQVLCLGIYMILIPPIFKGLGFKLAQKKYKAKDLRHFPAFKDAKTYLNYHKLACLSKNERNGVTYLEEIAKAKNELNSLKNSSVGGIKHQWEKFKAGLKVKKLDKGEAKRKAMLESLDKTLKETPNAKHTIYENLVNKVFPKKYVLAKGSIERSSIIGSVVGLTILAPELSHLILHPIMRAIGIEKSEAKKPEAQPLNKQA